MKNTIPNVALKERIQVQVEIGTDQAKNELNNLTSEAEELRHSLKGMKKNTDGYREASAKLKQTEERMKKLRGEIGLTALPLKELQKESKRLRRELNNLVPGTDAFIKKSKELQKVEGRIKNVRKGMLGVGKASNTMSKGFRAAMTALGPLLIGLFAFEKFQQLFDYLLGVDTQYLKLTGTIQKFSGLQGEALDNAIVQVQALGNTFDVEQKKIAQTANAVSKQMGISYAEALALIEKGMLAAPEAGEELLDQAKEYATQFNAAGASAEEMFAVITQSINDGVFSDKGADVVKEFGLRIREQTKATSDAMRAAFGNEFTDTIFKGINDGSLSTIDALKQVSAQMNNTSIPANKLQTVIADVFAGPGEDAGLAFIQSLKDMDGSMESLVDTSNVLTATQMQQLELEKELASVEQELAGSISGTNAMWGQLTTYLQILGTRVLIWVINGFKSIKDGFIEIYNESVPFRGILQSLVFIFKTLFQANLAFMTSFQDGLVGLGKGVLALLSGDFSKLGEIFDETTSSITATWKNFGTDAAEGFNDALNETLNGKIEVFTEEQTQKQAGAAKQQQKAIGDATLEEKKKQQERFQVEDKKAAEKLRKQREEARKKELEAERNLQDLRIALMEEGQEKEIAQLKLNTDRKIAALVGTPEQIEEQTQVLKGLLAQKILEIENESEEVRRQRRSELSLESEEMEKLALEEKYARSLLSEQEYQNSLYELQKTAMEERLNLLVRHHGAESIEVQRAKTALANLEKEQSAKSVENEERTNELKKTANRESYQAAAGFMQLGIELLGEDEAARRKNAGVIKAFSIGKILAQVQQEVAGYMAHPTNTASFGVAGAIKSALAIGRATLAISKVSSQKFNFGGIPVGPLHGEGGIKLLDPANMQVIGEMEGGEPILSRMTYLNNKPVVDQLLDASMNRNGAAIGPRFEDGGISPTTSSRATQSDLSDTTDQDPTTENNQTDNTQLMQSLVQRMEELLARLPLEIEGKWVMEDFNRLKRRIDDDDARSSL